ncbi:putative metalloendopeptidase [Operophtera brumata]|uniref:Putative metalloendopeptidase n=1 Tax=Operophtera brumata TaxID=104452 RepID=A0A0L7L518_OPEBR|nr:putative metalloendopeptidase [Operophtera brumata]
MSKFLSIFIQKTSGFLHRNNLTVLEMSKRSGHHRTPKFKPKPAINRKAAVTMSPRKDKIEVLSEPIKSEADKKNYKTIQLENGLTALLISDPSRSSLVDDSPGSSGASDVESSSGAETSDSEGSHSEHSEASDQHANEKKYSLFLGTTL